MSSNIIFLFVLQKLLEKMNKENVFYKPATAAADVDNDAQEGGSYSNGPREKKEFVYKKASDSDGNAEPVIDMTQPEHEDAYMKTETRDVSFNLFVIIFYFLTVY